MRIRCLYTLAAVCACAVCGAAGNDDVLIKSAVSCFKLGERKITSVEALKKFQQEAQRGNASAKAHLGLFYLNGIGVKCENVTLVLKL